MATKQKKGAKKVVKKTAKKATNKKKAESKSEGSSPTTTIESEILGPLIGLRDQMEDVFDRYLHGWTDRLPHPRRWKSLERELGLSDFGRAPSVDMSETDKGYEITAELPGMDEKDLDVNFTNGVLTIEGEKHQEREEKKKDYHLQERRYGRVQRSLRLPQDVDADKISASFKKGVLNVSVPKTGDAKKLGRKIDIDET